MKFKRLLACPALLLLLNACANGDDEPKKCIDNNPAPTQFSTAINELNHDITLEKALSMTNKLATMQDSMLAISMKGQNILPISETFNLNVIDKIVCQPNTVAFRAYLGLDPRSNQLRLIFVGVNPKGEDIIKTQGRVTDNPAIAETGQRFP